jgi:glutathione synthase/RimK-type ligase-like ATP-grasp enzyme
LIESLPHVVNPLSAEVRAERKVFQLRAAKRAGLNIPRTLISNDPRSVRDFATTPLVTKLLVPLSQTMDGSGLFMHTSSVDKEDLKHIDAVKYAPQIFQERIEKRLEVRVVVVGKTIFAASTEASALDWRLGDGAWQKIECRETTAIRKLMNELGLVMGALDFVVDNQNTWWFLEINPAGEWGWLEKDVGLPISKAIARELLA